MLCLTTDWSHATRFLCWTGWRQLQSLKKPLHCRSNPKSLGRSFILGLVTCWRLVLVNTVWPATRVPWDGSAVVTKENSLKVCCVCGETFSSVKNKHSLREMIHPSGQTSHWLWRTLQDKLHQETDYQKCYLGAVACFCDTMDKAKRMWSSYGAHIW